MLAETSLLVFLKYTCQFCNGRFVAPIRALDGIGQFNTETIFICYFRRWLSLSTAVTNTEGADKKKDIIEWRNG